MPLLDASYKFAASHTWCLGRRVLRTSCGVRTCCARYRLQAVLQGLQQTCEAPRKFLHTDPSHSTCNIDAREKERGTKALVLDRCLNWLACCACFQPMYRKLQP